MDILEPIKKEGRVIKSAPFSFLVFLVIGGTVGYWIATQYYSGQLAAVKEQINTKDAQFEAKDDELNRYRVVLGISPASQGALVALNNQELALRAQFIVAKLREYDSVLHGKYADIKTQLDAKKINQDQANKAQVAALKEVAQDYDNNLASDTYNVENELRTRLDPSALSHVIMVPGFVFNHSPRSRITFPQISGAQAWRLRGLIVWQTKSTKWLSCFRPILQDISERYLVLEFLPLAQLWFAICTSLATPTLQSAIQ